jgi:hypothetical protein
MSDAREQRLALLEKDEAIKELLEVTIQCVLEAEMEEAPGAGRSERTSGRRGYRIGYYSRNLVTRLRNGLQARHRARWHGAKTPSVVAGPARDQNDACGRDGWTRTG